MHIVFSCKRLRSRAHDPYCLAFHQGPSSRIKQILIIRTAEEDHVIQLRTHKVDKKFDFINSANKTKCFCLTPHRSYAKVSLETNPFTYKTDT